MAKEEVNFTKAALERIVAPEGSTRRYIHDSKESGLLLQITGSGRKSFQLYKKHQGKPVRVTIGTFPDTSVEQARKKAREIKVELSNGVNRTDQQRAIREEMMFSELFHRWLEQFAKPHKRTWSDDLERYNLYLVPHFSKQKLSWFSPARVRQWHHNLTTQQKQKGQAGATISGSTANRTLALLKTVFSQMAPDIPNPCRTVKAFKEQSRERFLQPNELKRLFEALESVETPPVFRDYVLLSLFTGARKSNVLGLRWGDIDFHANLWTIQGEVSKNGDIMRVPLVEPAIEILKRRKVETSSVFVLASDIGSTGHYTTPTKAWRSLLKRAGLVNVRLHDLRRTCGSVMAGQGASLPIIGKLLGHKHQASTQVYARLTLDPQRLALDAAVKAMLETQALPGKVVPLRKAAGSGKK
ncbi:MAG: site-specific integrase [Chlorobium sp.]|nr:site-specific integrase [Chlorobium sp.]